ncbi:hypothetical protein Vi05172_g2459 [Venturia inaequalis]|nr:hypothetical protein Vi05172_g2459 [Venturia inaequalis]
MASNEKVARAQENVSLGTLARDSELIFGVAPIFATKLRVQPARS